MFVDKQVFDTNKLRPGMAVNIEAMIMGVGDEYPRSLRRGRNYGLVVEVSETKMVVAIYDYKAANSIDGVATKVSVIRDYPIHIDDVTGRNPQLKVEVVGNERS